MGRPNVGISAWLESDIVNKNLALLKWKGNTGGLLRGYSPLCYSPLVQDHASGEAVFRGTFPESG